MAKLIIGTESNYVRDIDEILEAAKNCKQDFVVVPLFHPRNRIDKRVSLSREGPGTRSDMVLPSDEWIQNVVAKISEDIDPDNSSPDVRSSAEIRLCREFMWACHLGLQAVIMPSPKLMSVNYSRILMQLSAKIVGQQQIWIRIPLVMPLDYHNIGHGHSHLGSTGASQEDGWYAWDSLRNLCHHDRRIFAALELNEEIDESCAEMVASRWAGEMVKAIIVPTRIFSTNKNGFPVLSRILQEFISKLFRSNMHVIIKGRPLHGPNFMFYIQYIRHLHKHTTKILNARNDGSQQYNDYLQAPLQPLMDNLESQIYETFEKDPVKYDRYEQAVCKALIDLQRKEESLSAIMTETPVADNMVISSSTDSRPESPVSKENRGFVVTVVGAGRGPLVAAVLNAACIANATVKIYAVEKNPNAVITLRNRVKTESWTNVTVVAADMRYWSPPELADILVSELLGSWGDNELSPECLDGAQKCLKTGKGISIPCSYTSYLAPVSAQKLWRYVQEIPDKKGDTPYVVKFHNHFQLAADKPLFQFVHPNETPPPLIDNTRFANISFTAIEDATIHGFIGTFESVLYDGVMISIVPKTFSEGMFSWFPLFIPLSSPVRVFKGDEISAGVWRCVDSRKVWYEWCLTAPIVTHIQNSGGYCYQIGL